MLFKFLFIKQYFIFIFFIKQGTLYHENIIFYLCTSFKSLKKYKIPYKKFKKFSKRYIKVKYIIENQLKAVVKCGCPPLVTLGRRPRQLEPALPVPVRRVKLEAGALGKRAGRIVSRKPISTRPLTPSSLHPLIPLQSLSVFSRFFSSRVFNYLAEWRVPTAHGVDNIWRVAHSCPTVSFSSRSLPARFSPGGYYFRQECLMILGGLTRLRGFFGNGVKIIQSKYIRGS